MSVLICTRVCGMCFTLAGDFVLDAACYPAQAISHMLAGQTLKLQFANSTEVQTYTPTHTNTYVAFDFAIQRV